VNNTDVQVLHPGSKPKLDINCKRIPQVLLVDWKVDPGSRKMYLVLGEIHHDEPPHGRLTLSLSALFICTLLKQFKITKGLTTFEL